MRICQPDKFKCDDCVCTPCFKRRCDAQKEPWTVANCDWDDSYVICPGRYSESCGGFDECPATTEKK